jgi:hypothetical protein
MLDQMWGSTFSSFEVVHPRNHLTPRENVCREKPASSNERQLSEEERTHASYLRQNRDKSRILLTNSGDDILAGCLAYRERVIVGTEVRLEGIGTPSKRRIWAK